MDEQTAFVPDHDAGFAIIDISNELSLKVLDTIDTPGSA